MDRSDRSDTRPGVRFVDARSERRSENSYGDLPFGDAREFLGTGKRSQVQVGK